MQYAQSLLFFPLSFIHSFIHTFICLVGCWLLLFFYHFPFASSFLLPIFIPVKEKKTLQFFVSFIIINIFDSVGGKCNAIHLRFEWSIPDSYTHSFFTCFNLNQINERCLSVVENAKEFEKVLIIYYYYLYITFNTALFSDICVEIVRTFNCFLLKKNRIYNWIFIWHDSSAALYHLLLPGCIWFVFGRNDS